MKLKRLADHAIASAHQRDVERPRRRRRGDRPATAPAASNAAAPCTARRGTGCTPRQSSISETTATAGHAASQTGVATVPTGEASSATGMKPAQIARPPTRGTGRSWSERPVGRAAAKAAPSAGGQRYRRSPSTKASSAGRPRQRPKSGTARPRARWRPPRETGADRPFPRSRQAQEKPRKSAASGPPAPAGR